MQIITSMTAVMQLIGRSEVILLHRLSPLNPNSSGFLLIYFACLIHIIDCCSECVQQCSTVEMSVNAAAQVTHSCVSPLFSFRVQGKMLSPEPLKCD